MIKFFRRIRQELLTENKFSKYLLYAIGEIVLVVIGILIALQLNNAKEISKLNESKQNYYNQILVDLDKEVENMNSRVAYLNSNTLAYEKYNNYIETSDLEPNQILKEIFKINRVSRYASFNTNTIQTLESTGDIILMPEHIRNRLLELKRSQESYITVSNGNNAVYLNALMKPLQLGLLRLSTKKPIYKESKINDNIEDIILALEGALGLKYYTEINNAKAINEMLINVQELKELINLELKNK
ncbi:hypothetical protein [Winogradskyella helgolandensis]|uniref:hypothetical protein n=1 Tax=Winogradskyella helgolandensis TaxID=2697010 RepID=UPI0015CD4322|nr:hypothetical protein [Winogradskyella helgolandensis]